MSTLRELMEKVAKLYDEEDNEDRSGEFYILDKNEDGYYITEMCVIADPPSAKYLVGTCAILYNQAAKKAGMILLADGWSYPQEITKELGGLSAEEVKQRVNELGQPSQHPDRCTVAFISGITAEGELHGTQYRHEELQLDADGAHATGMIPDKLRIIFKELTKLNEEKGADEITPTP